MSSASDLRNSLKLFLFSSTLCEVCSRGSSHSGALPRGSSHSGALPLGSSHSGALLRRCFHSGVWSQGSSQCGALSQGSSHAHLEESRQDVAEGCLFLNPALPRGLWWSALSFLPSLPKTSFLFSTTRVSLSLRHYCLGMAC